MTCVVVFLAVHSHEILHVVGGIYMMGKGEELTSLFSDVALACFLFGYCLIRIQCLTQFMNYQS